jgi:excisionase family DNA binding protein
MSTTAPTSVSLGPTSQDRLIKFAEARRTLGLSKSTMYRMLERGDLPCPVKIGALTYFSERELQEWIANKLASRGREFQA